MDSGSNVTFTATPLLTDDAFMVTERLEPESASVRANVHDDRGASSDGSSKARTNEMTPSDASPIVADTEDAGDGG
jgi:hypothetical protein